DATGRKVKLPRGASDAALLSYYVDRSKLYIMERIQGIAELDAERIARAVEGSRFPSSMPADVERIDEEAALLRAADLIGQLGDPHYTPKANALYHEFEEAALNRQLGYDNPADLVHKYPQFYWNSVAPYIRSAIRYLHVTANGRQWIANLYSNFFAPNATSRSGDRSNDVARLCPTPADGQRRLNRPSHGCASLSTSSSCGSCFLRTPLRGAEPDKIAQVPAIGVKRVLLRSTQMCSAMECARHFKATTEGD